MKVCTINDEETSLIYESIMKVMEVVKDDDAVDMVFVYITEYKGITPSLDSVDMCKDLAVNIVCKNKKEYDGHPIFSKIEDLQSLVNNTFAYLTVWTNDEKTINNKGFRKFFARSFIVAVKDENSPYLELWQQLQSYYNIAQRDTFYIDFSKFEATKCIEGRKQALLLKKDE